MSSSLFVTLLLNSLSLAALLFFVASGLTLIFGLMNVVNLAHGAFYLLGGFLGLSVIQVTGNFWLGILVGGLGVAAFGLLTEQFLMRRVRGQELPEVLLTLGLALVISDQASVIWGSGTSIIEQPGYLSGVMDLSGVLYPRYRLFVIACAIVVGAALFFLYNRTRWGGLVRAGVDDREMVGGLGVNIERVFAGTFVVGAALAGIGGVVGGAILGLQPGTDEIEILLRTLVVIIIGGVGSLTGAIFGSVFIGIVSVFGQVLVPELSFFLLFAPMALVLVVRPQGLLGKTA
jgi:branched-chain amino acid transport system permease protein